MLAEELEELQRKEKEKGITPDWELDAFMRAEVRKGKQTTIITDLFIKMLGLDVSCTAFSAQYKHSALTAEGSVLHA